MCEPARGRQRRPRLVSVVVPVRNAADHLVEQLGALSQQTYGGEWEVILVDNGSSDDSQALARQSLPSVPRGRLISAPARAGASHARNVGASRARGDLLAFTDADDVPATHWLEELVRAAPDGDLIAGGVDTAEVNADRVRRWHVPEPRERALQGFRFLVHASGTNTGVWADTFHRLGGFDESTRIGEDIEFSWRAQLAGHRLVVAPKALVHYRLRSDLASLAVQQYAYGSAGPHLFARFRADGMPSPRRVAALRRVAWLGLTAPGAFASPRLRGRWVLEAGLLAGGLARSVRAGVLYV